MLNLLPPEKKQEIKREFRWRRLLLFEWMLIFALLIFIGLSTTAWIYALIQYRALEHQVKIAESGPQGQKIQGLEDEIKAGNMKVRYLKELGLNQNLNFRIIEEIINLLPQDIVLDSISLDRRQSQGSISGYAQKRNDLLQFKERMKKSDYFTEVDLPLTQLLKEEDIDFNLTFSLN